MLTRAILFDFGGVIWRNMAEKSRVHWAQRLGIESATLERQILKSSALKNAMLGKISAAEMWPQIGSLLGLDEEQSLQLGEDFFREGELNTELLAFARQLRPNYQLGILSNAWRSTRNDLTDKLGLGELFKPLIISAEEGVAKPDPRIYQIAIERLDRQPAEVVFLDDQLENVEAARHFGMRAVHYQNNRQAITEVQLQLGLAAS